MALVINVCKSDQESVRTIEWSEYFCIIYSGSPKGSLVSTGALIGIKKQQLVLNKATKKCETKQFFKDGSIR